MPRSATTSLREHFTGANVAAPPQMESSVHPKLLGVLVLVAMPVTVACSRSGGPPPPGAGEVEVDARCTGGGNTRITIRPWNLKIRQGDEVTWLLDRNANSSEITITPKREAWPFASTPPYRGSKASPARAGNMRPNARGRYAYSVSLICTHDGVPDTVLVDPDIIVD